MESCAKHAKQPLKKERLRRKQAKKRQLKKQLKNVNSMTFRRHHHAEQPPQKLTVAVVEKIEDVKDNTLSVVITPNVKKLKEEPEWRKILKENKADKLAKKEAKKVVSTEPIPEPLEEKKTKTLFIGGNTVELNDFKAICKKKRLVVSDVLNKIIGNWNSANYNL